MLKRGDKRAVLGFIVKFILLLVVLILILSFIYRLYADSAKFNNERACHDALVLQQTLSEKIPGAKYGKPWPSVCKTQDKVITAKNPQDAERELAELMSWCWWEVGEGVIKPFDQDWFSGGRKCFVCYTAQFPNLKETINKQDFSFYLQEQGRKGTSYYSYLKYGEEKLIDSPITDNINKEGVYAIVYTSPADITFSTVLTCIAGATTGGALAGSVLPGVGTVAGGAAASVISIIPCAAATLTSQILEKMREDAVYIIDVKRGQPLCYGTWYSPAEETYTT